MICCMVDKIENWFAVGKSKGSVAVLLWYRSRTDADMFAYYVITLETPC